MASISHTESTTQTPMHAGELHIDAALVKHLLSEQFPDLAELPLAIIRSTGTVNAVFRLGDDLCVRLPRVADWADSIEKEWRWLPKLAPYLSLRIPKPLAHGTPTGIYSYPWAIYDWIEGMPYQEELVHDEAEAARDLAKFILELRRVDMTGAPRGGRRPLRELDEVTRAAIAASHNVLDVDAVTAVWEQSLAAAPWDGQPVWIHADLLRSNLLLKEGHLYAVIDFGSVGIGDPAMDVVPAWSVFNQVGRMVFRQALQVDDETWARAYGYALHQALLIMPYYPETNPEFVTMAKRTIGEVLADQG
ncbi:MAG: aminoglycoside phosphotransferase family protein [Caldilineaceae bacterium]